MSFLEYYKIILEKVKFDTTLFIKEYNKALTILKEHEITELHTWLEVNDLRKQVMV